MLYREGWVALLTSTLKHARQKAHLPDILWQAWIKFAFLWSLFCAKHWPDLVLLRITLILPARCACNTVCMCCSVIFVYCWGIKLGSGEAVRGRERGNKWCVQPLPFIISLCLLSKSFSMHFYIEHPILLLMPGNYRFVCIRMLEYLFGSFVETLFQCEINFVFLKCN